MGRGRPSKYTPELIERAQQYLAEWREPKADTIEDVIPTREALASYLGISLSCLEKWSRDESKEDLLRVLRKLDSDQVSILINRGLKGDFNSNIAKLILSRRGYSETKDLNVKGSITCVLSSEDEDI